MIRNITYTITVLLMCLCGQLLAQASMSEVLQARLPKFSYTSADKSCKEALEKRYYEFKAQDERNSKRLTNQLQSHRDGWVEVSPGICDAGGPPPVCPLKTHWVKDGGSMQRWNNEQEGVRSDREDQLRKIVNDCNASVKAKQDADQKEKDRKAKEDADAKAAAAQKDLDGKLAAAKTANDAKQAAADKAKSDADARRQAEIDRINAANAQRLADQKAAQERLDRALNTLQDDIANNNRETEDKLERARQANQLNADNSGTISKAKDILNTARVNASGVFKDALGSIKNSFTADDNTSMSNMGSAYNDYERSGGENYSYGKKIASKIFGFLSPKQDTRVDDIPESGYTSSDESSSRTSKISSFFSSLKEKASWLKPTLPTGMVTTIYKSSLDQLRRAENGEEPIDVQYISKVGATGISNFIGMAVVGAGVWGTAAIVTAGVVTTAPAIAVGGAIYLIYNEGKKLKDFIADKQ